MDRRTFSGSLLLAPWLLSSPKEALAASQCPSGAPAGMTESDFHRYIEAFNRSDFDAFGRFYAADVDFSGQGGTFHGRDQVLDFYRTVKSRVREQIIVRSVTADETGLVADLITELTALQDWPDFPTGPLRAGEVRLSENFIWYEVRDGQITRIRSAHFGRPTTLPPREPVSPGGCANRISAEAFRAYIDAFNRDDFVEFGKYYDDDVVLNIVGKQELHGHRAIADFYRQAKRDAHRIIHVDRVISTVGRLAAELHSEFVATSSAPNFLAGPLTPGSRIFIRTFVIYDLRMGKFLRIRSAEFRKTVGAAQG